MSGRVAITGMQDIRRALVRLGKRGDELSVRATRPAAEAVLRRARGIIPLGSGRKKAGKTYHLRENLVVRKIRANKYGRVGFRVGQRGGAFAGETYYGSFVELGHYSGKRSREVLRARRRGIQVGGGRRHIEGKWYMKQAGDLEEANAVAIYEREISTLLSAEASK